MDGKHVLVGTDAGLFDLDGPVAFADREVSHLDDGWAVVDGRLHRRGPDGWRVEPLPVEADANCVAALGADEVLVGTREAHLVRVTDGRGEPVTSFEDAPTRDGWYTPWGGPPDVRSLAIGSDGTWYVNVHVGGILRSARDSSEGPGERWTDTIDLDTDVHQVVAVDGLLLAALGIGGLGISRDGGATWSLHDDGLHASYCRAGGRGGGPQPGGWRPDRLRGGAT
jgi:hypothetical protein